MSTRGSAKFYSRVLGTTATSLIETRPYSATNEILRLLPRRPNMMVNKIQAIVAESEIYKNAQARITYKSTM